MTPETLKWFNALPPEQRIPAETALRPEQAFPTERAFLGHPVRTSASVHLDAIRAAVREETADLRRDLGLAVEAIAAWHPLPTRDYGSVGWVVLRTEPDTGAVTTWTEEVYETRERAQEVVDDTHHYTRRLLSIGEVRRAS